MKIGRRALWLVVFAALALFIAPGCERTDNTPFTAEIDESAYRRAKELLRQGRNQEALAEFQKVIEKRGLNNAPESHLELGLLYQNHIRDPIAAIYHYRRYLELKPDAKPQADLVKQRIDAATREFARTLPAQPLENMERFDMSDVVQRLQRENEQLKGEVARLRTQLGSRSRNDSVSFNGADDNFTETSGPAQLPGSSPISNPLGATESAQALPPPTRPESSGVSGFTGPVAGPAVRAPTSSAASTTTQPPPRQTTAVRRHVVVKGDTLYSLSQKYYGTRSRWRDILEANRDILRTKDDPLRIGVEIKIPQ